MIKYYKFLENICLFNMDINRFMKYNPPCKECLVQNMCLEEYMPITKQISLQLKKCEKLDKFINSRIFFKPR